MRKLLLDLKLKLMIDFKYHSTVPNKSNTTDLHVVASFIFSIVFSYHHLDALQKKWLNVMYNG